MSIVFVKTLAFYHLSDSLAVSCLVSADSAFRVSTLFLLLNLHFLNISKEQFDSF